MSWQTRAVGGRHKTTGMTFQVVTDTFGQVITIARPIEGCAHDMRALEESGLKDLLTLADAVFADTTHLPRHLPHRHRTLLVQGRQTFRMSLPVGVRPILASLIVADHLVQGIDTTLLERGFHVGRAEMGSGAPRSASLRKKERNPAVPMAQEAQRVSRLGFTNTG